MELYSCCVGVDELWGLALGRRSASRKKRLDRPYFELT